jgi:hypothetical protein
MSEEVIFTWRRAGGHVSALCRGAGRVLRARPVMHHYAFWFCVLLFGVRRRSQTAVTSCTSGYFDSLLQLELHTSPRPAHMFMTNYIVPADHISVHQRVAESGVAM